MAEPAPETPEWWLKVLHARLVARRPKIERAADYYDGHHNLAFASKKFHDAFGGLFRAFADNWCGVVVDAVEERLNVVGFRVNEEPSADEGAKRIWEDNDLDLQSQMAHTEALYCGAAYVTVWTRDGEGTPEITVEPATSTIIARHPKFRLRRKAGLRTYCDDDGYEHAELFLPEGVWLYRSENRQDEMQLAADQITWRSEAEGRMPNPLGVVPIVELQNRPRLRTARHVGWYAHSEIGSIIPLQDGVNKLVADMLVASEAAAFPQRHATGLELETDPDTNEVRPPRFEAGAGTVWVGESEQTKFGQFATADLSNFVKGVELLVQHVASISRTPPHYLNASADRLSGESIKAAETGLVAKCKRRQTAFGHVWEEVMRLAGEVAGLPALAAATSMETIWADPESRTEAEHVDAVMKQQALGVPAQQLWEELGYSPEQIARFEAMRATDQMLAAALAAVQQPAEAAPVEEQTGAAR